ncbi:MAG: DUF4838 domain-containing protein [Planctomycetota bacterium]|jgi:hypothetical protein
MKNNFTAALLILLLISSCSSQNPQGSLKGGAALEITSNGKSALPVIVPQQSPPRTIEAANELISYIEKISGVKPELIKGAPSPLPQQAVWVGCQPVVKRIFSDTDFKFKHPEEILITSSENHLVIAGRDLWDKDYLHIKSTTKYSEDLVDYQGEYGTANAVYTFIQDFLGVRWLWPGKSGEDIIKKKTVSFAPFTYRYHPKVRNRDDFFRRSTIDDKRGDSHDWSRRQRLLLDSLYMTRGHGFSSYWERFGKSKNELFALQPNGRRDGFPRSRTAKLCQSNPAVWEQWIKDVKAKSAKNPFQFLFNGQPNDGSDSGICICKECRMKDKAAWERPERHRFMWQGTSQEYVPMTERYITFANNLARQLKKNFPDKSFYVGMHPYGPARILPPKARLDKNIMLVSISNVPLVHGREKRKNYIKEFKEWADFFPDNPLLWRPNIGYLGRVGIPAIELKRSAASFKLLSEYNITGIYIDTVWEQWLNQGPHFYLWSKMLWNPDQDPEDVMNDYYRRGFGPAAGEIKLYWTLLEKAYNNYINTCNDGWNEQIDDLKKSEVVNKIYTKKLFAKLDQILKKAEKKITGQEKYQRRIEFVKDGLLLTEKILDFLNLAKPVREGDKEAKKVFKKTWDELVSINKKHGMNLAHDSMRSQLRHMGIYRLLTIDSEKQKTSAPVTAEYKSKPEKAGDPDKTSWKLAFEDDFKGNKLSKAWRIERGEWEVSEGYLRGSGIMISSRGFPEDGRRGNQKLEMKVSTDIKPMHLIETQSFPKVQLEDACDITPFIHAAPVRQQGNRRIQPAKTGYLFQFGGFYNTRNELRHVDTLERDLDPEIRIIPDKEHIVVFEKNNKNIRCLVDGKVVFDHFEPKSNLQSENNLFGFYLYTKAKIDYVKLYVSENN